MDISQAGVSCVVTKLRRNEPMQSLKSVLGYLRWKFKYLNESKVLDAVSTKGLIVDSQLYCRLDIKVLAKEDSREAEEKKQGEGHV